MSDNMKKRNWRRFLKPQQLYVPYVEEEETAERDPDIFIAVDSSNAERGVVEGQDGPGRRPGVEWVTGSGTDGRETDGGAATGGQSTNSTPVIPGAYPVDDTQLMDQMRAQVQAQVRAEMRSQVIEGRLVPSGKWNRVSVGLLLLVVLVVSVSLGVGLGVGLSGNGSDKKKPSPDPTPGPTQNPIPGTTPVPTPEPSLELSPEPTLGHVELRFKELRNILEPISGSALNDTDSAQYQALNWIAVEDELMISPESGQELVERYVLALLYFATKGSSWNEGKNFLRSSSVCEWNTLDYSYGVACNAAGSVAGLNLESNSLQGAIPFELGYLSNLDELHLSSNDLTGKLPSALGRLAKLTSVELAWVRFSSLIPSELGNLNNLKRLRLDRACLSGHVPSELGRLSSLNELFLSQNTLSGTIPTELGNLSLLWDLLLFANNFQGDLSPIFCDRGFQDLNFQADCGGKVQCDCCTHCCGAETCADNGWCSVSCCDTNNGVCDEWDHRECRG